MEKRERRFEVVPLAENLLREARKRNEERTRTENVKYKPCRNLENRPAIRRRHKVDGRSNGEHLQQPDPGTGETKAPKRVLVVDNERIVADTLTTILRNAGYEARVCYDESNAFLHCESFRPDVMITDVIMPGINGIQMAIQVRQRYPDCRILLFSGHAASVSLLEEARRNGHDFDTLEKTVHPSVLLARIAS
jgi:PleD family two-component response regulator